MLEIVWEKTQDFLSHKIRADRKKIGQFFTTIQTARFMASLFELPSKEQISILDPGAGSGILAGALIERIAKECTSIKHVILTCYENNPDIFPILQENINYLQSILPDGLLEAHITFDNYITNQSADFNGMFLANESPCKYDLVIGNPPYKKISSDAAEAKAMPAVCYGAPNLYFLFAAMSLFNLRENGQLVYILPRSWTSGAYFKAFREYFLNYGKLINIHLFVSRESVFGNEQVLQETIIIRVRKQKSVPNYVQITSTDTGNDYSHFTKLIADYSTVVSEVEKYVYLITSHEELRTLAALSCFPQTLPGIGLRMKTGLTVDFRNKYFLRNEPGEHNVPLFYAQHIQNGNVVFPTQRQCEYIVDSHSGLIQKNKNYVFVKRFTSKEETRRLQCGIYRRDFFPQYDYISTQNKINFIDCSDGGEMPLPMAYGIYVLLNSSVYDTYYRILNGSTQVNSTEINGMPMPDKETIMRLGKRLITTECLSTAACDSILEGEV